MKNIYYAFLFWRVYIHCFFLKCSLNNQIIACQIFISFDLGFCAIYNNYNHNISYDWETNCVTNKRLKGCPEKSYQSNETFLCKYLSGTLFLHLLYYIISFHYLCVLQIVLKFFLRLFFLVLNIWRHIWGGGGYHLIWFKNFNYAF